MKKQLLLSAAILLSVSAFSQTRENTKREHGTQVSTVAKTQTEAGTHGAEVSAVASARSQASLEAKAERRAERMQRKEEQRTSRRSQNDIATERSTRERSQNDAATERRTRERSEDMDIKGSSKAGVKAEKGTHVKHSRPNVRVKSRSNGGVRGL